MNLWDFASAHPITAVFLGIIVIAIADSVGVDVVRSAVAIRLGRVASKTKDSEQK